MIPRAPLPDAARSVQPFSGTSPSSPEITARPGASPRVTCADGVGGSPGAGAAMVVLGAAAVTSKEALAAAACNLGFGFRV